MSLRRVTGAGTEPVDLATAKLHLRVTTDDEDARITSLIKAARMAVEERIQRALITQTWRLGLDRFPWDGRIVLPRPPLISVDSITYTDDQGTPGQTVPSSDYVVDVRSEPGRIWRAEDASWPATARQPDVVLIEYQAGYGEAGTDVPQAIIEALLLELGALYDRAPDSRPGRAIESLLGPFEHGWAWA